MREATIANVSERVVTLPVAILAGGLGTRLRGLTGDVPKALVEVAGKPFACHQIELLARAGVTDMVFCVGHLGDLVRTALADAAPAGVRVRFVADGRVPLGTGGALRRALPELGDAFFVLYGDSYLECDYAAVERAFKASGRAGLMTVYRNEDQWDRSNVAFDGSRIARYDKTHRSADMHHIDYGLGVLTARALAPYAEGEPLDLTRVYQDLLARDELAAFEVATRFYEIGSPAGLREAEQHLLGAAPSGGPSYAARHLDEARRILDALDVAAIERMATLLAAVRRAGGRVFFVGVGGSAANCSHAVNDFRKLAGFEAYTPVDNVSELTARTNDDGWDTVFEQWLIGSRIRPEDAVFVLSVGGGSLEHDISPNLVRALDCAKQVGASVLGIVGRDGGYTARVADAAVVVPTVNPDTVTPHAEAFQAVIWHLLVSHPLLKVTPSKWESTR